MPITRYVKYLISVEFGPFSILNTFLNFFLICIILKLDKNTYIIYLTVLFIHSNNEFINHINYFAFFSNRIQWKMLPIDSDKLFKMIGLKMTLCKKHRILRYCSDQTNKQYYFSVFCHIGPLIWCPVYVQPRRAILFSVTSLLEYVCLIISSI